MKVIFLNAWHGKRREPLRDFLLSHAETTDVFCFQEADLRDGQGSIAGQDVPGFTKAISCQKHERERENFFLATYVRDTLPVLANTCLFHDMPGCGLALSTTVEIDSGPLHLINLHGVARPGEKLDNPDRLTQSKILLEHVQELSGITIVGGDFNVLPETESLEMFRRGGYRDLIKEFGIDTTRNRLAWEKYPVKILYSDYLFVSPEITVKDFSVPKNEISDHLPLVLEFEI